MTIASCWASACGAEDRGRLALRRLAPLLAALLACGPAAPAAGEASHAAVPVSVAFAAEGRLWRVTPTADSLVVDSSRDEGRHFDSPVTIKPRRQRLRLDPEGPPRIAVDGQGNIHVAWTADARDPQQAFVASSTDAGATFGDPVSAPAGTGPVAPQLRPLLVPRERGADLYFVRQPAGDGGDGTLQRVTVGAGRGQPSLETLASSTCECCRLAAATDRDGSTVLLSRMVYPGGIRDFGLFRLPASGGPGSSRRVTDDNWRIDACPEHGGAVAIDADGRYHLAWFTQGARRQGLFYAHSDDRGVSWSAPLNLGSMDALAGHADVLAVGARVYLAWQQFDGRQTHVIAMSSANRGDGWSAPRELGVTTAAPDHPRLVGHGARAFVSWSAGPGDYRLIALEPATGQAGQPAAYKPLNKLTFRTSQNVPGPLVTH